MAKNIKIYTFSTCPFCSKAKRLLDSKGVEYEEFEIGNDRKKLDELEKKTNSHTVPQIFVDDEFIGGCDDLVELDQKNKLDSILGIK